MRADSNVAHALVESMASPNRAAGPEAAVSGSQTLSEAAAALADTRTQAAATTTSENAPPPAQRAAQHKVSHTTGSSHTRRRALGAKKRGRSATPKGKGKGAARGRSAGAGASSSYAPGPLSSPHRDPDKPSPPKKQRSPAASPATSPDTAAVEQTPGGTRRAPATSAARQGAMTTPTHRTQAKTGSGGGNSPDDMVSDLLNEVHWWRRRYQVRCVGGRCTPVATAAVVSSCALCGMVLAYRRLKCSCAS